MDVYGQPLDRSGLLAHVGQLSQVGIEGPWYREPAGLGWLRSFGGGLLVTGGLDHVMSPETADPPDPSIFAIIAPRLPSRDVAFCRASRD